MDMIRSICESFADEQFSSFKCIWTWISLLEVCEVRISWIAQSSLISAMKILHAEICCRWIWNQSEIFYHNLVTLQFWCNSLSHRLVFSLLFVFGLLFFFMLVSLLLLLEEPVLMGYVSGPDRQSLALCLLLRSACVICEGKKWERENPCQSCYEVGLCYSWVWQRQRRVLEPNPQWVVILQEYAMLHHTCMHKVGNVTQLLCKCCKQDYHWLQVLGGWH